MLNKTLDKTADKILDKMLNRKGYSSKKMSTEYAAVNMQSEVGTADPHRLVSMLLEGALLRIAQAKLEIEQGRVAEKISHLTQTIAIVDSLRASLNTELGGEIVENLGALYEYITHQLVFANSQNSIEILDEVTELLIEVNSAWSGIGSEMKRAKKRSYREVDSGQNEVRASFSASI